MMNDVSIFIAGALPLVAGALLVASANCRPAYRYRQLGLPVLAVVYSALVAIFFSGVFAGMQGALGVAGRLLPYLAGHTGGFATACAFNFVFLACFAVLKTAYRGAVTLLAPLYDKAFRRLYGRFYYYDAEREQWFLRDSFMGVRLLLRNMYIAVVALGALLFALSFVLRGSPLFQAPCYPCFAVLLTGELCFFLAARTKREYVLSLDFEADGGRRIRAYTRLQDALDFYFGDRLIGCYAQTTEAVPGDSHRDFCQRLIDSDDFNERLVGTFFMTATDKGLLGDGDESVFPELNHDYVQESVRLLNGQSVMFASPFYRDYVPYVFLPMVVQLMRNRKVAVLYGSEQEESVRAFVEDGLSFVVGVPGMWHIGPLPEEGVEVPDVVLVPFATLGDTGVCVVQSEALKQLAMVLVIDPSSLLATYQVGLSVFADYVSQGEGVVFCIFDKNSDGLVDSLSHALRTSITEVSATGAPPLYSATMFWNADGAPLQHRLFPDVAHYLGIGTELGLVALRKGIEKVSWVAQGSVPLLDLRWILGQYYREICEFAELPSEQIQVDERFRFYPSLWSMERADHLFLVAEDESFNLFETMRQYDTRGTDESMMCVLSSNYLLRSYMASNAGLLAKDPKAVPAFAPDYAKSRRNAIFSIVMLMIQSRQPIPEEEVRRRLTYAGIMVDRDVARVLDGLIAEFFDEGAWDLREQLPASYVVEEVQSEYDPATRRIVDRKYFQLDAEAVKIINFESLRNVPLVTEEPDGTSIQLGSRLRCHVSQVFLPGQHLTIQGKYYEVVTAAEDAGVVLRRAADHFSRRRYYRQLRSYRVTDWRPDETPGKVRSMAGVDVVVGSATVAVQTNGYLDLADYGDLRHARRVELPGVPVRNFRNKAVLQLKLEGATEPVVYTLAVLMSEMCKTLYPSDYPYIAVLTGAAPSQGASPLYETSELPDVSSIYFVEDSLIDIGLISSLERNLMRILEMCWEYLDWHEQMLKGAQAAQEKYELGEVPGVPQEEKKLGLLSRLWRSIKRMFRRDADDSAPDAGAAAVEEGAAEEAEAAAETEAEAAVEIEAEATAEADEGEVKVAAAAEAVAKESATAAPETDEAEFEHGKGGDGDGRETE